MSDPLSQDAALLKAQVNQPSDHDDLHEVASTPGSPETAAEKRRRWVEANRDQVREMNRRWRAEHLERARQLNRDSMRRATARQRRQAEIRDRGRERAKRWREAHPDRVREYKQQWAEKNREKVREYYNRYYANHRDKVSTRAAARRDANPDRTKQTHKLWAERNKERRAESQRARRADPDIHEAELAANAAARRLKRRLERAGLPAKQLHPATAAERRANEREADAYFGDPALPEHLRQFTVFAESLSEHMLKNGARMQEFAQAYVATRKRLGLPPVSPEGIAYARAVELIAEGMRRTDLLTSRDIAAAVRSTKAVVLREERNQQFEQFVKEIVTHTHRNIARLTNEAVMENMARGHRGKPPVPLESLVVWLSTREVLEYVRIGRLAGEDVRNALRLAELRVIAYPPTPAGPMEQKLARRPVGI